MAKEKKTTKPFENDFLIVLDVGGRRFKTWRSTLQRIPNTRLAMLNHESKYYNRETGEYFFDRNPDIFENVLDFYRTGELHVPLSKCGWSVKLELDFWGINWKDIKRCCWNHFNSSWCEKTTLEKFDEDVLKPLPSSSSLLDKAWLFLEYPSSSRCAMVYSTISYLVIVGSVLMMIVSTLEEFRRRPYSDEWAKFFDVEKSAINDSVIEKHKNITLPNPAIVITETACLSFFMFEYFTRFICSPDKLKFFICPMNLIDLFCVLHSLTMNLVFYFSTRMKFDDFVNRLFRAFEVVRVFRLFRLMKKYRGFQVILYSLIRSSAEIALLIVVIVMGTILFGSLIYYADDRDMFDNMFRGLWWAVITITTVGYGDYYPVTPFGCVIGTICALSSMLIVGISVSEIVSSFDMYYRYSKTDTEIDEPSRTYRAPDVQPDVFLVPNRRKPLGISV
ncbi:potassium voltage-gated channel protein Shaw-like [Tubulanus polymorphus]|uniref:potassium voltage-gated channel protein Shaw-like n=1 Tax=Tubulanus polymorphus TaxID=672921 RepID=UPI003DA2ABD6